MSDTEATAMTTGSPRRTTPCDVFVGRRPELGVLTAALADVVGGRGRLVLLAGEPGIGKTRIAEQFADQAREQGARVVWGRCFEGDGAPPFWPWVEILRTGVRALEPGALLRGLGSATGDLTILLPELQAEVGAGDVLHGDAPEARFRLADAVVAALAVMGAAGTPLVVVLDDLHGADRPTLWLLELVARRLRELPLMLVGSYRDTEPEQALLGATIAELVREPGTERVKMQGWSRVEIGELLRAYRLDVPPPQMIAIEQQTAGNPLFVRELAQALVSGEAAAGNVPSTVRAVIARRLASLSDDCRRWLQAAAVLGRESDLAVLGAVLASDGDGVADAGARAEAVDAGVVIVTTGVPRRCRFTHVLVRDALYAELDDGRAIELHRKAAAVLERLPDTAVHLATIAYHYVEAHSREVIDRTEAGNESAHRKAVEWCRRAAEHAMATLAFEESTRWYEQALALLEYPGASDRDHAAVLVELGIAQREACDLERSKATLRRAAALARRGQHAELLARAALHFGTKVEFGERLAVDHTLVSLLEDASAALGAVETAVHARVLARLARALNFASDKERRLLVSRRALVMARRVDDAQAIVEALHAWLADHWSPDNLEERLALAAELVSRAETLHDSAHLVLGHSWQIKLLAEAGDWPAARAARGLFEQAVRQRRDPLHHWWLAGETAALAITEGRFAAAATLAQEASLLEQRVSSGPSLGYMMQSVSLWTVQGQRAPLESVVAAQIDRGGYVPDLAQQCSAAWIASELGRRADAVLLFERLAARDFADFPRAHPWFWLLHAVAEVCAYLDDAARALRIRELLAPYEARVVMAPSWSTFLAPVAYDLALVETVLGRWDDAERHFEHALAMCRAAGARPSMARTQCEYARMCRRRGAGDDGARATRLRADALRTARELDMPLLAERLQAVAESFPPTDVGSAATGGNVFQREGEYWTITFGETPIRLRDTKGLHYIAHLLRNAGREIHVTDLLTLGVSASNGVVERANVPTEGDLGVLLDPRAVAEYKTRLADLREQRDEATAMGDRGRAERVTDEIEIITHELSAAYGLGGRARRVGDPAERARKAVTNQIRRAIDRIDAVLPALGRHLRNALHTGLVCTYRPEQTVAWTV